MNEIKEDQFVMNIPEKSLVVLIGPSGAGKSTFARRHFLPTEVLSSDYCRGLVCDDTGSLDATTDAFEVLHFIAAKRLKRGLLTVVDATNVQPRARRPLVALARKYHMLPVAIVLDVPEKVCHARNDERPDRNFGRYVVRNQRRNLQKSLGKLRREKFRSTHILKSVEEIEQVRLVRRPMYNDLTHERGPFDIIGDIHGCCDELEELLEMLGYVSTPRDEPSLAGYDRSWSHPQGRKAVFVGDLIDRGPRSLDVVELVRQMVDDDQGICVPGNHENKLLRKLRGKNVKLTGGLATTMAEIDALPSEVRQPYRTELRAFLESLISHYLLDEGRLVVAHAGLSEELQGRASGKVRSFALYGDTTGEKDEFGFPVRRNWAAEYTGDATVVYGHTPVAEATWLNKTINIDTGCVFGGRLTALRYPERELVSQAAAKTYVESPRPLKKEDDEPGSLVLDLTRFLGTRTLATELLPQITIRDGQTAAAIEVMSRFAVDPRWLIYLPPTMAPTATSQVEGYLERPEEVFSYFRSAGQKRVICEEKHMGSRAIVVVARDTDAVQERFGFASPSGIGRIFTRTGRPFFRDEAMEEALLDRTCKALSDSRFWEEFETDWVCLDTELMPWSVKAKSLLRDQYAPVGSSGAASLGAANLALTRAAERGLDIDELSKKFRRRQVLVEKYRAAYREYCWPVESLDDLQLAPFHIMATEGTTYFDRSHQWHMETIAEYLKTGHRPSMFPTKFRVVELGAADQVQAATRWWEEMTDAGGEGMVVKPFDFIARDKRNRVIQPAVKCRGKEYLRIIYGPEYTEPENLKRLRKRGLGRKRSMAFKEFCLGLDALKRFVNRAPLYQVHERVLGVLALESESVDPRL